MWNVESYEEDLKETVTKQGTANVIAEDNGVWLPKSGSKYHKYSDCSGMNSSTNVLREDAENQGYEPCKKCFN